MASGLAVEHMSTIILVDTPMDKATKEDYTSLRSPELARVSSRCPCCMAAYRYAQGLILWHVVECHIDIGLYQIPISERTLSDGPPFYGIHARLLSLGGVTIHRLCEDLEIREVGFWTLLCTKGIALEPSMMEQLRRSRMVRRAILHHWL